MEFKDPWGGSAHSSRQVSPQLTGPSSTRFLHGRRQNFFGSYRQEQLSTLFTQIPFWQYSEWFFSLPCRI